MKTGQAILCLPEEYFFGLGESKDGKKTQNSYGDGIAKIYRKKDIEKNVRSLDDLEYLGFLYFTEKSRRQQDIEFIQKGANRRINDGCTGKISKIMGTTCIPCNR